MDQLMNHIHISEIIDGVVAICLVSIAGYAIREYLKRHKRVRDWIQSRPWAISCAVALITSVLTTTAIVMLYYPEHDIIDQSLRTSLANWDTSPDKNGSDDRVPEEHLISKCPTNTYAVGFVFQSEPGLAHGALWTGYIVCRPLNLPQ